jgi:hypothetical protein
VGAGVTDIAAVAIAAVAVTGLVATAVSAAGHSRRRSYCRECAGPQVLCGRAPLSPPLLPPSTAAHAAITAFALVLSSTSHIASAAVPTAAITAALPLARAERVGCLLVGCCVYCAAVRCRRASTRPYIGTCLLSSRTN